MKKEILVLRDLPIVHWGFGLMFAITFAYLIFHFVVGRNIYGRVVVHEENITWWMILLIMFLGMLSCTFIYSGKFKTTILDKRLRYIELRKTTVFCKAVRTRGEMTDLFGIHCYKRGFKGLTF